MQAANYPLPAVSASGQKVLPLGFVAADRAGQAICAWGCLTLYTLDQLMLHFFNL